MVKQFTMKMIQLLENQEIRLDRNVTQQKHVSRHQYYWNKKPSLNEYQITNKKYMEDVLRSVIP